MPPPVTAHAFATSETFTLRPFPVRPVAAATPVDLEVGGAAASVFEGFGLCFNELGWRALSHASLEARNALLDAFFLPDGDLRFRFCRLPIGANDYSFDWYSHDETPEDFELRHFSIARDHRALIPYIREGLRRQPRMKLFASPWSPPTWLKNPPVMNFGTLIQKPAYLRAYADYFVRFVQAYAAEGIRIDQVHVQNEPVSSQKFPSCVVTGEEFRVFIGEYLGPAFARAGLDTEIWLGTLNGPETDGRKFSSGFNEYLFPVMEDATAARYVRGASYQWAGKHALARTRQAYPELPLIQSENECGDGRNTWEHAWYVADLVQHYLSHDCAAYVYWNGVLEPGGLSTWGWPQNSLATIATDGAVTLNPEYHLFRHFSTSIAVGARRRICQRPWAANALAYAEESGILSVVIRNPFDTPRAIRVRTPTGDWQAELPARSLTTLRLPT